MTKYIHYCWFGDKPLPKLAKKCIESWKKYLPDYEIIKWSEENVDLEECPFIKEAYDNKKWAFVADYARTKALKEMGGIYFDTDMEITKKIDHLFNCNTFLGIEDTGFVAVGVWYEKNKEAILPTKLLDKYRSMSGFSTEDMTEISIPKLISGILDEYGLKYGVKYVQKLENDIYIYPRDYFYPYSYNRDNNVFTENTCMIHYYDASWIPLKDRIENNMVRRFGRKKTFIVLNTYRKLKDIARKAAKIFLFPVVIYREKKRKNAMITNEYLKRIDRTIESIKRNNNSKYIVLHNSDWLGVTSATKELFDNTVDCGEIYRKKDIKNICNTIIDCNIKQVIFSSFAIGDYQLVKQLKRKNRKIKIKTYWHGSHSQILDAYGWDRNLEIIKLHKAKLIDVMASCKYSLQDFYKKEGYTSKFITNKVTVDIKPEKRKKDKIIRIGLYAAKCDDWRKNMYSQMAAISLIENAVIDMVPLNENAKEFAEMMNIQIEGLEKSLPREELLKRMSQNDINLYVTFSECAPMLPLESFEMNVPCITGNNHHYFTNTNLEEYIVVKNEENPIEIKNKILGCIQNKEKIIKEYKKFRDRNLKDSQEQVKEFIEM
ncbi:MAG: hypothetical protein IKO49_05860 [Bacilli bacterium]|nr:hypothetical protein [Bacilli bacterium]